MQINKDKEIWKPIAGYEGLYEISSFGRVKSVERTVTRLNHLLRIHQRILKPGHDKDGYKQIFLSNMGVQKMHKVHRLVAIAFITNKNGLPMVNHKDENKANNHVSNLEWCDCKYNNSYGTAKERMIKTQRQKTGKPVIQKTMNGKFINTYRSTREAARITGIDSSSIRRVCTNIQRTAGGYIWSYRHFRK